MAETLLDLVGPQHSEQPISLMSVNSYDDYSTSHLRNGHRLFSGRVLQRDKLRGKWPSMLWFLMKILGIFHQDKIISKRRCFQCSVTESSESTAPDDYTVAGPLCLAYDFDQHTPEGDSTEERQNDSLGCDECDICNISQWDYYGRKNDFSDEIIGVSPWNHRGSKHISVIILLILVLCICQEIYFLCKNTWGKPEQLLHTLSYGGYIGCLSVYPVMCICSKLRYCGDIKHMSSLNWAITLNARFIVRRLQFLMKRERGLPGKFFLFICIIWPSLNVCHRGVITFCLAQYKPKYEDILTIPATELLLIEWGSFTYLLYIMRLSFQHQFDLVLFYVINREGQLDKCRHFITNVVMDFNCFRKFTQFYMAAVISFSVLGATTIISTQYRLTGTCYYQLHYVEQTNLYIVIWSTILMFVSLSMMAIGGLDLNVTWYRFKLSIIQASRSANHEFWQKLLKHATRVGNIDSAVSKTVVFSVITLYTGLRLQEYQDLSYYGSDDNCTEWKILTPSSA